MTVTIANYQSNQCYILINGAMLGGRVMGYGKAFKTIIEYMRSKHPKREYMIKRKDFVDEDKFKKTFGEVK
jgi:hypothetical protein